MFNIWFCFVYIHMMTGIPTWFCCHCKTQRWRFPELSWKKSVIRHVRIRLVWLKFSYVYSWVERLKRVSLRRMQVSVTWPIPTDRYFFPLTKYLIYNHQNILGSDWPTLKGVPSCSYRRHKLDCSGIAWVGVYMIERAWKSCEWAWSWKLGGDVIAI